MTKLHLGLWGLSAAAIAAAVTGIVYERNTAARVREEIAALQQETRALVSLHRVNTVILAELAEAAELRRDDAAFCHLEAEAAMLRTELQKLARSGGVRSAPFQFQRMQVYSASTVDRPPVPQFQPRPQYPDELQRAGIRGEVLVDFTVDTDGNVQNAHAARSSSPLLAPYAVDAVRRWKFAPGRKQGENVPTRLQVPIVFELDPEAPSPPLHDPDAGTATHRDNPFVVRGQGP